MASFDDRGGDGSAFPPSESQRIMARAKREADDILAKAQAILEEAKSVQSSLDHDIQVDRARARRIGFDEGFRAGRAGAEESSRTSGRRGPRRSKALELLMEAAGRLRDALERFEADRKAYLGSLRKLVRRLAVGVDGEPGRLPDALARFLEEAPPRAALRPEDEIWLEKAGTGDGKPEPSLAVSGEPDREGGGGKRTPSASGRGRARRRRGNASR